MIAVHTFTRTPGPRHRSEGPHSGEQFLEELLEPRFREAMDQEQLLVVDLDGTAGYPTSFLEEAFGGLARRYSPTEVLRLIRFKTKDEPYLEHEIREYIQDAKNKKA